MMSSIIQTHTSLSEFYLLCLVTLDFGCSVLHHLCFCLWSSTLDFASLGRHFQDTFYSYCHIKKEFPKLLDSGNFPTQ
jgi:hypothetical protein